ncbi:uncharacterized protein LAESUDRAFT_750954 [Laetiporus sulphureus 93-53]|uniref:Uncharacterized protein n=1 Tax=Laetiporus sulphureus 93-53 TaxID=1314785 RepID=A0A165DFV1_9APHY|nr:uncharacterized protein LAESUDRAFT_750954 [Laetiporus sulphureus 93-53]KZT04802.1 hypothetical protein LAESUDRAFT_750954 [Laetiporus sulphureus 93-53]
MSRTIDIRTQCVASTIGMGQSALAVLERHAQAMPYAHHEAADMRIADTGLDAAMRGMTITQHTSTGEIGIRSQPRHCRDLGDSCKVMTDSGRKIVGAIALRQRGERPSPADVGRLINVDKRYRKLWLAQCALFAWTALIIARWCFCTASASRHSRPDAFQLCLMSPLATRMLFHRSRDTEKWPFSALQVKKTYHGSLAWLWPFGVPVDRDKQLR